MNLSEENILAMNDAESKQDKTFFSDFAKSITIYEDDDILVVDKPAGLLSVDGRVLKVSLLNRLQRANDTIKLIHRLDMDTSGIMIFAKSSEAQSHVSKQFIERLPQKEYQAVVMGTMGEVGKKGTVDVPVRYEPTTKPRHIVDMDWKKHALTKYQVLAHESIEGNPVTRLKLLPVTGRSHQLRVHMVHIGHVMIGDPIYAEELALELAPRLNLHAHKLRLKHPIDGVWMEWESDVPF